MSDIEIDQSGKIEDTSKDTAVGFSDDVSGSIIISAKDKREIQAIFRKSGKSRIFVYRLFTTLIFLLIRKFLNKIDQIIIDEEYPGKSYLIKNYLSQEIEKIKPDFLADNIIFKRIGRKSKAHSIAYLTFKKRIKPNIYIRDKDILKFIVK